MALGDAVHRGISAFLSGGSIGDALSEWTVEAINMLPEDMIDDDVLAPIMAMSVTASGIVDRVLKDLRELKWEVVYINGAPAIEMELSIPLPGYEDKWDGYTSHLDALLYDPRNKHTWLVDWKTRKNFQGDSAEEVNLQHVSYLHICAENGIPVSGSITYQIKNQVPAVPTLNKDGSMSRTRIATDWDTYKAELEKNGLSPIIYGDMRAKLDTKFTDMVRAYRSETEIARVWNNVILAAVDEIHKEKPSPLRSMGFFNCERCSARAFCLAALRGHDIFSALAGMNYDREILMKDIESGTFA